jgi:carboxyl-terminal processing protease
MVNDIITHIDGVPVRGLTPYAAVDRMRGPIDTKVRLTIRRNGHDKPIELTVVRDVIRPRSVRIHRHVDDIGYIRVASFNETTMDALQKGISELSGQIPADKLKGYVLDLRNSPGGLPDQAIAVTDAFLEDGEIGLVRGRDPVANQTFNARPGDIVMGKPLIVLINGGTAGVAEIVAGALQHHKRATVIGARSFGRGWVQSVFPLGVRRGALSLTTGRSFDGTGIMPDIEVPQDVPDRQLNMAYDLLSGIAHSAAFPPNK